VHPLIAQADPAGIEHLAVFKQQVIDPQPLFIIALYGAVAIIGFALLCIFTIRIQNRPLVWAGPLARLAARPWTWRHALAIVLPLIALQLAFAGAVAMKEDAAAIASEQAERSMLILQGVLFHGIGLLLMIALMRRCRIGWTDGFGLQANGSLGQAGWGILILLGTMPVLVSFNIAAHLGMEWWGLEPRIQDVTRVISTTAGWPEKIYFLILAVVMAPVVEEMIFRGMLLPALSQLLGIRAALVATAALFALVHGFYMPACFVFFILSLSFSLAYIYRGSLLVPVVMHALFNGLSMAVLLRI